MKTIKINNNRRLNQSSISIGFKDENKAETILFDIPSEYLSYNKKACFKAGSEEFSLLIGEDNTLTLTSNITRFKELDMAIEFFADDIVARTSKIHLIFEDTITGGDVPTTEPQVIVLDDLIEKVNNLDVDLQDTTLTITRKDGTKKSVDTKGEKGDKGDPGKFQVHIVEELPTTGEDGVMYLVKKETTGGDDLYNEYIYADSKWNLIGNTHIDLSDYYTKMETYSIEEVHNLIDEIEAGVELYGYYENEKLSLSLLDNISTQLSKIDVDIPQYKAVHYVWDKSTGEIAKAMFQNVYNAYVKNEIVNVDLVDGEKRYKLTSISNPRNRANELYCQFVALDYYTDKTDFVFMQSVNAVLTLNGGIVESVSVNESTNQFRLIREYDGSNGALPTNNTKEYTPTMPYEPATKKYVDETQYKNMVGWNSQRTQVLKNINGKPTWINE